MIREKKLIDELGRFADLDSNVQVSRADTDFLVRFCQYGVRVELRVDESGGRVIEKRDDAEARYSTFKGLLASAGFGNLRRFAEAQKALLTRDASYFLEPGNPLPVNGVFIVNDEEKSQFSIIESVNSWLASVHSSSMQRALVIDGPAGIGKTHMIRSILYRRICDFGPGSAPLILHVQSRGRKLTTLNDVIAGTLNTMRVAITYEQLPVLVRHGLIDVAIDGFDELADPNGYETAWSSLRDFVEDINGQGALILAGRDTFIDASQIKRSLTKLDTAETATLHLKALFPGKAKNWLAERGVPNEAIEVLTRNGLMDEGSYALRPFFILQIQKIICGGGDLSEFLEYPLKNLIEEMILREANILQPVLNLVTLDQVNHLLFSFFKEIARDMADGERDWIDQSTLALISDLIFMNEVNSDDLGVLRHRVGALAMLESDVNPSQRRFSHSEILDFFLSSAYIDLILNNDLPKSIRRNIFGSDFLETFHNVVSDSSAGKIDSFLKKCSEFLDSKNYDDRGRANISALMLAASSFGLPETESIKISSVTIDEACVRGTLGSIRVSDIFISQFDCRGADMRQIDFNMSNCQIYSIICDDASVFPANFPTPKSISFNESGQFRTEYDLHRIDLWIKNHQPLDSVAHNHSDALELFDRLCRIVMRQNWIRAIPEDRAGRALESPLWAPIKEILERANLLSVRSSVAVGGPRSDFIRIHHARDLLNPPSDRADFISIREKIAAVRLEP